MAKTEEEIEGRTDENHQFEKALAELEGIVQRLEKGELPLEDSLVAFERGIGLVRHLSQRLQEVEQRVEVLLKTDAGKLVLRRAAKDEE
jgi:exodeoxyribonuclease VII small subunit